MKRARGLPPLLLALAAAGCVSGSYSRECREEPIAGARLDALRPGHDDLAACLAALGAPERVLEYGRTASGDAGMVLVWFWRDVGGWGLNVQTPSIDHDLSASFAYDAESAELPACALWFGPDLVLQRARRGMLGELLPARRRPAGV